MVLGHGAMKAVAVVMALAVAACLGACGGGGGGGGEGGGGETAEPQPPALQLPDVSSVARIQVSTDDRRSLPMITNPEDVARVLEMFEGLDAGWAETTEPIPPIRYSSSLSATGNAILLVIWIGDDWLAANNMQKKPNVRQPFVGPERAALLDLLGIDPEPAPDAEVSGGVERL